MLWYRTVQQRRLLNLIWSRFMLPVASRACRINPRKILPSAASKVTAKSFFFILVGMKNWKFEANRCRSWRRFSPPAVHRARVEFGVGRGGSGWDERTPPPAPPSGCRVPPPPPPPPKTPLATCTAFFLIDFWLTLTLHLRFYDLILFVGLRFELWSNWLLKGGLRTTFFGGDWRLENPVLKSYSQFFILMNPPVKF